MIRVIKSKADDPTLREAAEDFDGYIKVVVDIRQKILAAVGERHVDAEQMLLQNGSRQDDLWGGGLDLETGEIDFDSMINIRPGQNNASREVLSRDTRSTMKEIIRELLR